MELPLGYELLAVIDEGPRDTLVRARARDVERLVRFAPRGDMTRHDLARRRYGHELARAVAGDGVARPVALEATHNGLALVLEDLGETTLRRWIAAQPEGLAPVAAARAAAGIARALAHLHGLGVTHKGIDPRNVLIDPKTLDVRLTGFEGATRLARESPRGAGLDGVDADLRYVSPEQTGRMNRGIDYRTDLYALGAVLYEMLTGAAPFAADDPVALVHAHIAVVPRPPHALRPEVPAALSDVALRLLAKNAEDRYQSAAGLLADLTECARQLAATGTIEGFVAGARDAPTSFLLPQRLYGREAAQRALLAAFERASAGAAELVLVSGESGVGKSALVHEVQRPLVRDRGYFAEGKFDALQSTPYGALIEALQGLLRQILGEREARVVAWRARLREALGAEGRVVTDVIPEVALLVGPQPAVPAQGPTATQNRFRAVFARFIEAFARAEHPVALFLDDLQWADAGSLNLLSTLLRSPGARHLLLIGAYRDNAVDEADPLRHTLAELRAAGAPVEALALSPLGPADIEELVCDALGGRRDDDRELARVVFEKTAGNPFFVGQFLSSLHARGLLAFDPAACRWAWTLEAVRAEAITENVAALVTGRLRTLSPRARDAVRLGACCEGAFDLATLSSLRDAPAARVAEDLWDAVQADLLVPVGDGYQFVADPRPEASAAARYRFAHDRVHEAAYALIPEGERPAWHLRIGRLWRARLAEGDQDVSLFALVHQLNLGRALITDPAERRDLATLNLDAGRRARDATAYASAAQWLSVATALLDADGVTDDALAREAFRARAECDYLLSRFDEAAAGFTRALGAAHTRADKRVIYSSQLALYESRGSYDALFAAAREALRAFDIEVPPDGELQAAFGAELAALTANLAGRTAADLARLPELTDPEERARVQLLAELMHFGSYANPMLFMYLAARLTNLSLVRGHAPGSAIGYVGYAMVLAGAFNDYAAAHAFGRLALDLGDRFDAGVTLAACRFMVHLFINPWRAPLSETIAGIDDVYRRATEVGALTFVGLAGMQGVLLRLVHGDELGATAARARAQVAHQSRLNQVDVAFFIAGFWRAMNRLTLDEVPADDPRWLDDAAVRKGIGSVPAWIAIYNITQQMAAYLVGDLSEAAALGEATLPLVPTVFGFMIEAEFRFYDALTRMARGAPEDAAAWRETLDAHLAKLSLWATQCPVNFAHRDALARAELARLEGRAADAIDLYDRAIEAAAAADGRVHDQALAHELAGRFHLAQGRRSVAWALLLRARTLYARWGANAKVAALDLQHPDLAAREREGRDGATTSASLDLAAALRASQALSGQIVLSKLLRTLMTTMLEAAGAQRGHLILFGDTPSVVRFDPGAGDAEPVVTRGGYQDREDLATDLVRYVARTRERAVLGDAARSGRFATDPYVAAAQPRSVLCIPVVRSQTLVGVVYLENNLAADAFTAERCAVLDLLAAQAAISLENARLYDTLDSRVRERTAALHASNEELSRAIRQMRAMQRQLVTHEKLASLGALTSGIAHEIRNPLNFVNNFAEAVVTIAEDLDAELRPARARLCAEAASAVDDLLDALRVSSAKIVEHGRRADRIVGSMLEHARSSGGERTPTDLARLVSEHCALAWQSFKARRPQAAIAIEEQLAEMPPVPVVALDLGRVIVNLVNNALYAVTARPRGADDARPTIRVRSRDLGDRVEIRVWDNGIGVPTALREKIFHPFFTTKPAGEGTGLGLSISHDIVVQGHGGTLTVASEEGLWAEFVVTLPRAPSDASAR